MNERVELEIKTVWAEIFKIDRRGRVCHDIGIVLGDLQQNRLGLAWIAAVGHANRDHNTANVIAKCPVLHFFGDEVGIRNENVGPLEGLDLGR